MNLQPTATRVTADCLVQQVIERHPETIGVLAKRGMQCVGCYISPYHTITDVAREYGIAIEPLLIALNQAVAGEAAVLGPGDFQR